MHRHRIASSSIVAGVTIGILAGMAGCEKYQPMPLDPSAVDRALQSPSDDELISRSAKLHHPMLEPVRLDPDKGLTPDEAAVVAVLLNPSLRAQRDQRNIARAAVLQAGILPNPQLTMSYEWNTSGTVPGNVNPYGIGGNYDITALIDRAARQNSAALNARSVDLQIAWQEWQTAEAAKVAVYDLMSLLAQRGIADQVDHRLADNLQLIQKAARLRLKTELDLSAAETASRDAHAVVLQADRDVRRQQLLLNRALGVPPETPVRLRDGLSLTTQFAPPPIDELLHDLQQRRLDLLALYQGYQSQEQNVVVAVLDQFPKINLGFARNSDNTAVRSLALGVGIDIPIFNRNQGVVAAEKATRQRLFDEYVARLFDARADVAQAVADILAINRQIADIQAALPSLQTLVGAYKEAVNHGGADVLSYYTAWNTLSQKNLDLLKLQQQLADNRVALEIAAGRYFSDESGKGTTRPSTTAPTTLPGVKP